MTGRVQRVTRPVVADDAQVGDQVGLSGQTTLYRGASRSLDIEAVAANIVLSVTATQHDVNTAAARALQLPTAATVGDVHVIQDVTGGAGANNITVTDQGGGTINGGAAVVMNLAYEGRAFRKTAVGTWVTPQ